MGKIIYYEFNKSHSHQCEEQEKIENLEELYRGLRDSTIEVIKSIGKVPKLDITQLSEAEKELFYNQAQEILHKDKNYIKTLIEEKR